MRRTLGFVTLLTIVTSAIAAVASNDKLSDLAKALTDAKSVRASYTVQAIGGSSAAYNVALKRPNLARIESPTQIVIADGTKLTVVDKAQKIYFRKPQSDADLKSAFAGDEMKIFAGFFDSAAYQAVSSKDLGTKNVGGRSLSVVESVVTPNGRKVVTYYLDPTDNVARKSQIDMLDPGAKSTTIVDTKSVQVNADISDDTFKFSAPAGYREVTADELTAKWYYDLNEAKRIAKATNRKIFVDFYAEWCGPCKRLEADVFGLPEFRALSKKLVFLRIDVDRQPAVSKEYNIEAMPTQMVINPDGTIVNQTVGYANASAFFTWIYSVVGR